MMPLLRQLPLPLSWVCWAALTSCGVASVQPGTPTATGNPTLSQPDQRQSQEAMPELGVFDDGELDNSLDPGHSDALGEGSLLDE